MSFFTLTFAGFLTGVFLLWWLLPQKARPWLLALANLVFAAALGSQVLLALLGVALAGYGFQLLLAAKPQKGLLWLGILLCLAPLAAYKYLPVLVPSHFAALLAPLGLSFYTFKSISCLIEVQTGRQAPIRDPAAYFGYIGFFPQLPMGPIQRPGPFFEALSGQSRHLDCAAALNACVRICWALFLKKCLADPLASYMTALTEPEHFYTLSMFWSLGAYCLYLYFDFAAYSHLALAFGELLGLPCAENFKSPYFSRSLGEFWRRWHISLSSFLRDYVYIPMGGSRRGTAVLIAATLVTFLLSGVWHGATGGFLLWGALHGVWLLIGRLTRKAREGFWGGLPRFFRGPVRSLMGWGFTLLLVFTGWFFFYAGTLPRAAELAGQMLVAMPLSVQYIKESLVLLGLTPAILGRLGLFLFGAGLVDFLSRDKGFGLWSAEQKPWLRAVLCYLCLFSVLFFGAGGSLPGVYFAF